jgi:chromosome segregation ATPase
MAMALENMFYIGDWLSLGCSIPANVWQNLGLSSSTNAEIVAELHLFEEMVMDLQETVHNQEKVIQDLSEKIRLNELALHQHIADLCALRNDIDTTHDMAESSRVALSNLTEQHKGTKQQLDHTEFWILRCLRNIQKILRQGRLHQIGNASHGQDNAAVIDQSKDDSGSPASQEAISRTKDINGKRDEQKGDM